MQGLQGNARDVSVRNVLFYYQKSGLCSWAPTWDLPFLGEPCDMAPGGQVCCQPSRGAICAVQETQLLQDLTKNVPVALGPYRLCLGGLVPANPGS